MSPSKTDSLREEGTLNPHPEAVNDPLFREGEFFDPEDVVQVKYEMLRRVRVDGQAVGKTAADFGVSRPTYYEALSAFDAGGIAALVPKKRGPRGPHKLADDVLAFVRAEAPPTGPLRAAELARRVQDRFGVSVHPRTIERALRREKKRR
ncbi:MAG: helix-turn-helix domain containing protein [Deltaproteobacteria bacterium]|nr:helix-turn-helix domain containing protein [Deltaproteobacteria bacterium]